MPTPTTWLPPIPGLHRRDPEHRYWLGDVEFPVSVTGVTGVKSDYAMDRIEATREVWAPRGNSCHRALELMLLSQRGWSAPTPECSLEEHRQEAWLHGLDGELRALCAGPYADWIQPLITHDRWGQLQIIASERPTCCLRRKVAGTFDVAYLDEDGRRILADLKSLGENGSTYSTAAQLGGYMALEASWGNHYDAGQTIWCRPGQTTFSPLHSLQECRTAWAGAWASFKARASEPGFIS
jgi:hypothetical protein